MLRNPAAAGSGNVSLVSLPWFLADILAHGNLFRIFCAQISETLGLFSQFLNEFPILRFYLLAFLY